MPWSSGQPDAEPRVFTRSSQANLVLIFLTHLRDERLRKTLPSPGITRGTCGGAIQGTNHCATGLQNFDDYRFIIKNVHRL